MVQPRSSQYDNRAERRTVIPVHAQSPAQRQLFPGWGVRI